MGSYTNIEWCDSTVNGSSGCDGCELWNGKVRICYAGNLQENRLSKTLPDKYAADFKEVREIPGRFMEAARWCSLKGKARAEKRNGKGEVVEDGKPWLDGLPRLIFVGDMGDFLSKAVGDDYLKRELLGAIKSEHGQRHFWLLLTKQVRRLVALSEAWGGLPDNCMAMTTVTSQRTAEVRIPELLKVRCRWRGLSVEPMLGEVDLKEWQPFRMHSFGGHFLGLRGMLSDKYLHWVIAGGCSGTDPANVVPHPQWFRSLRDQCQTAGVPFFFKQWGNYVPQGNEALAGYDDGKGLKGHKHEDGTLMLRVGTGKAGAVLDGREWREMPGIQGQGNAGTSASPDPCETEGSAR